MRVTSMMAVTASAVAAVAVMPVAAMASRETPKPRTIALQKALDEVTAAGAVAAIAEVKEGPQVWRLGSGTTRLGGSRPVSASGRYRAGSITKTFVATVALQLVGEGRLRLTDTVERWLPGVVPQGNVITVRDVLQHSSGLYDYTDDLLPQKDPAAILKWRDHTFTPADLVQIATAKPLKFAPGSRQGYSNTDYIVAGMIVEAVTGRSYADEIDRRILRPLRLHNTQLPGARQTVDRAYAHVYVPRGGDWNSPVDVTKINPTIAGAAGEIISTTAELNRFYRALMKGWLLRPAELREMTDPRGTGIGMGVEILELKCGRAVGHGGGGPGFFGMSFTMDDGSRQITATATVWKGNPGTALVSLLQGALCPSPDQPAMS